MEQMEFDFNTPEPETAERDLIAETCESIIELQNQPGIPAEHRKAEK